MVHAIGQRLFSAGLYSRRIDALIPRHHYVTLNQDVYLNQASLGLIPRGSVDAMTRFLMDVAQHGNVRLSDAAETGVLDEVRAAGARLLGTSIHSVAVTGGASEGLSQAASILASSDGEALLVTSDFPSVTSPWLSAEQRLGMALCWVDDRPDTELTAEIIGAITDSTTVVCVSSVQYATGSMIDVAAVAARAHEVDASVVIDVTQMAGAAPVDMNAWGADVMVCSGYKWLSSHGGVALLAISDELRLATPRIIGWKGTVDPFDFDARHLHLTGDGRRFELSTMAYSSAVGLTSSLELLEQTGFDAIARHADDLSGELVDAVARLGWRPFRLHKGPGAATHIVSLVHDRHDAYQVQRTLAEDHRVFVSSRGARIRVSLHGYNDSSDIDRLAAALATFD